MPDDGVSQKTVSRKLTMSCAHTQRIRLQVPDEPMSRDDFDAWVSITFRERAKAPCPTCVATEEAKALDEAEVIFTRDTGIVLDPFPEEQISVATYARSIRADYFRYVDTALQGGNPADGNVTFAVLAAALGGRAGLSANTTETMKALVYRHLLAKANQYQARYWITHKARMMSHADRDARNPAYFVPALVVALAGYPTLREAESVYRATFRAVTETDKDLAASGAASGLNLSDLLDRIVFMHALTPEPVPPF